MSIVDADAYRDAAWDWGMLAGCFGDTRISPSDWDGVVERGGYFLQIEGKPGDKPLGVGQRITYENRVRSGVDTVVVIWGAPPDEVAHMQVWAHDGYATDRIRASNETFRRFCATWFDMANTCHYTQHSFLGRIRRWSANGADG